MRVLGRDLVDPFTEFWEAVSHELPVESDAIERGLSSVFGDQSVDISSSVTSYSDTGPTMPRWMTLPDDDLAYHVAHELTHTLMRERGYPKTLRGIGYPPDSAEARVGEDLEEMVLHPSLESILEPFGFGHDFIVGNMASGAMRGLQSAPVPEYGTPWHFTWAIRFCMLQMELPLELWSPLEIIYAERAPAVTKLGRELARTLADTGWGSPQKALDAMVRTRDALGLDIQDKVLVLDPTTGRII